MTDGSRRHRDRSGAVRQTPSTRTGVGIVAPGGQRAHAAPPDTAGNRTQPTGTASGSAVITQPASTGTVAGIDASAATQSGADTRRRGWFWHWNSIVTQFAPLIGLKGVGLLNSYTVWTDRREDSPNRGYAFPSQQSEADFYGEERAELITINKILVALDLIEIRKEMIVKPDAQGRRWKVPHNFYRVKDHDDGYMLSAPHVLNVVRLADTDRNVYRYLRRVFSGRFRPIDGDSVWHQILPELRRDPTWQRLAAKVEGEEQRASDRTRAGHAARQQAAGTALFSVPNSLDSETGNDTNNDSVPDPTVISAGGEETDVATTNRGSCGSVQIGVATANNGLMIDDDPSNSGRTENEASIAAVTNHGDATVVAPTNTTYNQRFSTTRTMTTNHSTGTKDAEAATTSTPHPEGITRTARKLRARRNATAGANVRAERPAPLPHDSSLAQPDRPRTAGDGPDAGTAALQAFADANDKAPTTAQRQLLARLADEFDDAARSAGASGWSWVTAAIYEAVESGSAFVAPRRIREILNRWQREGAPGGDDDPGRRKLGQRSLRGQSPAIRGAAASARPVPPGRRSAAMAANRSDRSARSTGAIEPHPRADADRPTRAGLRLAPATDSTSAFVIAECGLPAPAVWAAMLTELALNGEIPRADLDGMVRPASLIGRGDADELVVGVTTATAQRRLTARYLPALRQAAEAITGATLGVIVVGRDSWLAEHPDRGLRGQPVADRGASGG